MLNIQCNNALIAPMISNEEIRKEQKAYLERIMRQYNVALTTIARESGVVQTTLTRFYNSTNAKNCLSATTLEKIKARFPMNKEQVGSVTQADMVIANTVEAVLALLIKKKYIMPEEIAGFFESAIALYQAHHLTTAMTVMRRFQKAATGEAPPSEQELIHKLLSLAPVGSA